MIVFSHLLNDRSGSPRVLATAIRQFRVLGEDVRLFIGSEGAGILDEAEVLTTRYWYKRGKNKWTTLFSYIASQLFLFIRLLSTRDIPSTAVVYVNTLLPFGAAFYGVVTRRKVVYHLHEASVRPAILRWLLVLIARLTADCLIFVSDAHKVLLHIEGVPTYTVYNALENNFVKSASANVYRHRSDGIFRVLMLSYIRDYKGVPEFMQLADSLSLCGNIHFDLVANDNESTVHQYFDQKKLPLNMTIHPRTSDPAVYYRHASLVVNLSRPDLCVETFGLTLLEAMAYGIPVIAPPVGGPSELVSDGVDGFELDSRDIESLASKILVLAQNEELCYSLSGAARCKAARFNQERFTESLCRVLETVQA